MKYFSKKYIGYWSIIFTTFLFVLIYLGLNIGFEENDDILMALISSGEYSGETDFHLIFINVIYGAFLNGLYNLLPNFEWYSIVHIGLSIVATSVIANFIVKSGNTRAIKTIFLVLLYSIFIAITIQLQFTYTAGFVGIAGICLLFDKRPSKMFFGMLLLLIASLIRFKAGLLVIMISGPLLLLDVDRLKDVFFSVRLRYLTFALLLISLAKFIDYKVYSDHTDWNNYKKYNEVRGQINDNPNALQIRESLPLGVHVDDYNLLLTSFPDGNRMSLEVITAIRSQLKDVTILSKFVNIRNLLKPYYLVWLFILLLISVSFIRKKSSFKNFIPLLMYGILLFGLSFVALEQTVKNRVFVIAVATYSLLIPLLISELELNPKKLRIVGLAFLSLIILLNFRTIIRYNGKTITEEYANQYKLVDAYLSSSPKKLSPYGTSLKIEYVNPFNISEDFYSQQMYFGGWLSQVPFNKGNFDSFEFFINGNGMYITKLAYKSVVDIVVKNIYEDYKLKVKPQVVLESEKDCIVEFIPVDN